MADKNVNGIVKNLTLEDAIKVADDDVLDAQKSAQNAQSADEAQSRVPKTKVVDTRKATNVNLDKYDEKLQDMADSSDRGGRRGGMDQNKEKFRNAGGKKK